VSVSRFGVFTAAVPWLDTVLEDHAASIFGVEVCGVRNVDRYRHGIRREGVGWMKVQGN